MRATAMAASAAERSTAAPATRVRATLARARDASNHTIGNAARWRSGQSEEKVSVGMDSAPRAGAKGGWIGRWGARPQTGP